MNESVIGYDALFNSMLRCRHGVMWKNSTTYYYLHGIEETIKLEKQLKSGTYKAKPPKRFLITRPKEREAVSIAFRDRIYQRSLNDNVLYPAMSKSFIYANFACQKGKGTDLARNTLKEYMHSAFMKYGQNYYILQCDIHGYYPNMRHDVAENAFRKKLPNYAFKMTENVLHSQYEGNIGYNPGSQMIQIAGISVLSPLDHYIKEQLHIKYYLRYMDDFILIHGSKEYLYECKQKISEQLAKIGLELHPTKTKLYPVNDRIMFLGFFYSITETGKVLMIVNPKNVKLERRKLRKLITLAKRGAIKREKVDRCYESWKAHASKGNSFHLLQRMDKFYKEAWL